MLGLICRSEGQEDFFVMPTGRRGPFAVDNDDMRGSAFT